MYGGDWALGTKGRFTKITVRRGEKPQPHGRKTKRTKNRSCDYGTKRENPAEQNRLKLALKKESLMKRQVWKKEGKCQTSINPQGTALFNFTLEMAQKKGGGGGEWDQKPNLGPRGQKRLLGARLDALAQWEARAESRQIKNELSAEAQRFANRGSGLLARERKKQMPVGAKEKEKE